MRFPLPEHQKWNQQIGISPESARNSKLTGVEINTYVFQTGSQLSDATSALSMGLRLSTQFLWHETNVLDNWQLAV